MSDTKSHTALRVSVPRGIQRSSYTLSMPFRYSIPMLAAFSIMHWLLSQATFIIRIDRITWEGEPDRGWTTGGYSLFPGLMGEFSLAEEEEAYPFIHCPSANPPRRESKRSLPPHTDRSDNPWLSPQVSKSECDASSLDLQCRNQRSMSPS